MKKLLLLLVITISMLSLNSCSSDSSSGNTEKFTFKVNGTTKTFDNFTTVESGGIITVHGILAAKAGASETITLQVSSGETGPDALVDFEYSNNTDTYYTGTATFTSNVTKNDDTWLKGTFSGNLNSSTTATLAVTNGSFAIER